MPAKKHNDLSKHLVAGGSAGFVEAMCCHPLDTIKTRIQLRGGVGKAKIGVIGTASKIITKEGPSSLYKGLSAVVCGIVPKMAIRFWSFEVYKDLYKAVDENGVQSNSRTFLAGLSAGVTEAVLVVTPMETCKVRLQAQMHSMADPLMYNTRPYKNVLHAGACMVREEGISSLYKGLVPTIIRQGSNQAVNFTMYQLMKRNWLEFSKRKELMPVEHFLIGGLSGGMGPCANCPMDVVKTRLQKQKIVPGETPKYQGAFQAARLIAAEEGVLALWKGLTPRLMRIMPGQAITFMVYERVSKLLFESPEDITVLPAKEAKTL